MHVTFRKRDAVVYMYYIRHMVIPEVCQGLGVYQGENCLQLSDITSIFTEVMQFLNLLYIP